MRRLPGFLVIALSAITLFATARDASAGFVVTNPTVPKPPPPIFRPIPIGDPIFYWSIDVWFTGTPGGSQLVKNESFFTFFDIPGLIEGGNTQPSFPHPFGASYALLGRPDPAPSGITDDASILNITYRYVGNDTITVAEGETLFLGTFTFLSDSEWDELPDVVQFYGESPKPGGGKDTTYEGVGVVSIVPEPSSLAMILPGAALMAVTLRRRLRRRAAA